MMCLIIGAPILLACLAAWFLMGATAGGGYGVIKKLSDH